jgi:hypothetical protein
MTAREYIQEVFKDMRKPAARDGRHRGEIFMMAALDVLRELDSPLKEETLVRLVILEATDEDEWFGRRQVGMQR